MGRLSGAVREAAARVAAGELEPALWQVLRAETSCNFYWGEAWVPRCHADLDGARHALR